MGYTTTLMKGVTQEVVETANAVILAMMEVTEGTRTPPQSAQHTTVA